MASQKIKVGVIPAAGAGNRMGYLGKVLPKCLFPLYDKPIIHYVVENMRGVGVEQVYVVVNYQMDKVIEYFKEVKDEIGVSVDFIYQKQLLGIANAVMLAREYVNEPFMVELGDDCTVTNSLQDLVNLFFDRNAIVVEGIVKEEDVDALKSTCCLELDDEKRIVRIEEKPEKPFSDIRGCGLYVFVESIFEYIRRTPISPKRGEIEITDVISLVARDGGAYGEFINGTNININTCEDLLKAWIPVRNLKLSRNVNTV